MKKKFVIILVIIVVAIVATMAYLTLNHPKPHATTQTQTSSKPLQEYYAVYKDPYVLHLRKALTEYANGHLFGMSTPLLVIQPDKRSGYIDGLSSFDNSYYKSKFVVVYINKSIAGGKDISIVFVDKPDKVFEAWVYKLADGKYDLRGFSQMLAFTPQKMKDIQVKYKSYLADKNHML